MSCGRRVVHHLVAATLVAHWPHHGGASLPFPPLTLTPGQDLRGGESSTKRHKTQTTTTLSLSFHLSLFLFHFSVLLYLPRLSFQLSAAFSTCFCLISLQFASRSKFHKICKFSRSFTTGASCAAEEGVRGGGGTLAQ